MSFEARISSLVARYKELKDEISKPFENQEEYIKISKENITGIFFNNITIFKREIPYREGIFNN